MRWDLEAAERALTTATRRAVETVRSRAETTDQDYEAIVHDVGETLHGEALRLAETHRVPLATLQLMMALRLRQAITG